MSLRGLAVAALLVTPNPLMAGEAVVLFDQSLAGSRAEPLLAERVIDLLTATGAAKTVTIVGFDEEVGILARAVAPRSAAGRAALRKLRHLRGRERHADFEPVFRHLAEDLAGGAIAVLISHGAPEVWDARLSPMIKADDRYHALNEQYRELLAAQATRTELLDLLGPAYRARDAALTAAAAARLRPLWGERLIVWDVSGESPPLKAWSAAAGARYVGIAADSRTPPPAELKRALAAAKPVDASPPAAAANAAPTDRPWMRQRSPDHDPSPPAKAAPRIAVETGPLMPPPEPTIVTMPEPAAPPPPPPPPSPTFAEAVVATGICALVGLLLALLLGG